MERELPRWEEDRTDDADLVLVAYGTSARIAREAADLARRAGIRAGLVRPITLWPFPAAPLVKAAKRGARFLVVEMSWGQMMEDVKLALYGTPGPVDLHGRCRRRRADGGRGVRTRRKIVAIVTKWHSGKGRLAAHA